MLQLLHRHRRTGEEGIIFVAASERKMMPLFRSKLIEWLQMVREDRENARDYTLRLVEVTSRGPLTMLGPMSPSMMLRMGFDYLKGMV